MSRKAALLTYPLLGILLSVAVAQAAGADPPTAAGTAAIDHTFWYISRAAGLTAYLLLALNVCLGLMVRTRALDWLLARWRSFDLHQFTALLALGFVLLHVVSLLGDQYIGFTPNQLLLPFTSSYRPVWVALGIIGLYLMLVIVASFYVRRLIGHRLWRTIHFTTFAVFLLGLLHGLFAGTDTSQPWALTIYWVSALLVAALTTWRFMTPSASSRPGHARETAQIGGGGDWGSPLPGGRGRG